MPPDESLDLFERAPSDAPDQIDPRAPLAERMRPRSLDELLGQEKLLGPGSALRSLIASGALPSIILWGPPGSGKTTLARVIARRGDAHFEMLSAVMAGVKEIRQVVERARREPRRSLLFLDELHRLNRAQQDALLPHVEAGTVTLIGATTQNPSFEVNAPLLSRCRVFTLDRLGPEALGEIVRCAASDEERGLGRLELALDDAVVMAIAHEADGDARRALGLFEAAAAVHRSSHPPDVKLSLEAVKQAAGRRLLVHDRDREEHYNVVSAFIKSMRACDPDAALYYAARMLDAGEDPLFLARRLVIFASEDVGNADPTALAVATAAHLAIERIGMPEGRIPLAHAISHLACAPKSNAAYMAMNRAQEAVASHGSLPVPLHLRNAATGLMKELGYGRDYRYPHDAPDGFVTTPNLPEGMGSPRFYEPTREGAEAEIAERLERWRRLRRETAETED
jgi:putative ATPase